MLKRIGQLLRKDIDLEIRSKYGVFSILLYLISIVFLIYFSFVQGLTETTYVGLLWIVFLFLAVTALVKNFLANDSQNLYYYFLTGPLEILVSKLVYSFGFLLTLSFLGIGAFEIFFFVPRFDFLLYIICISAGILGLSSTFALIAAVSSHTSNQSVMMAVLGFPVTIPILLLSTTITRVVVLGGAFSDISIDLLTLLSIDVIIIALGFILFPYLWKS